MVADFSARGLARQTAQRLSSASSDEGSALVGYHGGAATVGRSVQSRLRDFTTVRDFGAVGDGIADDTVALQAAINAAITTTGGRLIFPRGTYKISAKLIVPVSYGWVIEGASRLGTRIVQHAANTPILSFEGNGTWGWAVRGLQFSWNTPQPAANTSAVAIRFGTGTAGHTFFQFEIADCTFEKGFRGIAADPSASPSLWGFTVRNCNFANSMTGAAVFAVPNPAVGQPNIAIEKCLIDAASASEEALRISMADVISLRHIEFLNGAAPAALMQISTSFAVTISDCKSENYNVGATGAQLFKFSQCNVRAFNLSVNGLLGSGGGSYFLFGNTNTSMSIFGITAGESLTGGTLYAYTADNVPFVCDVKLTSPRASDDVFAATGCAPRFDADRRQRDRITDIGDASAVLTSSSTRLQYCNTALTANRSVTLPNSGNYEGMEFEVVRKAATPGAFTLQIIDPVSGNNYTFAASTNGFVRYRYRGGWRVMSAGAL